MERDLAVDPTQPPLQLLTAHGILTTDWPEPVWAIPNLLPVGLTILAGRPKVGAKLVIIGRDVEEQILVLSLDRELGCWRCEGDAHELEITECREILDVNSASTLSLGHQYSQYFSLSFAFALKMAHNGLAKFAPADVSAGPDG
jgi:hypothetical protein